jgi:alanyl-tRNA synthetase
MSKVNSDLQSPKTAAAIRKAYISWFEERGHHHYPSDSLRPTADPTLLFTGAGMNQFKDMFLGKGNLPWKRITTVQKCLRVPDLEKVGVTPRHHTFFEMLGNFSFGDYFKRECLAWIFGFFTERLGIDRERLVVTIYSEDEEAYSIWTEELGVPIDRVYRFGEKENFWPSEAPSKGPNGPCGPCSEIYFDLEPKQPLPPKEGMEALPDRFLEIGNCVFTQFDRQEDGSLPPLPQRNIDVGLGFERICAVVQGVPTNYDTDLFLPLILAGAERAGIRYGENVEKDSRLRRISDHVRAVSFCIADGILPGNEGRSYVVRKILRRAARDGIELGIEEPFLSSLADVVVSSMGEAWPELKDAKTQIEVLLEQEEKGFRHIYNSGAERIRSWLSGLPSSSELKTSEELRRSFKEIQDEDRGTLFVPEDSGAIAFELHDTFGFPVDITRQMLLDQGYCLDERSFEDRMDAQRARAREGSNLKGEVFIEGFVTQVKERGLPPTQFLGYDQYSAEGRVLGLGKGPDFVPVLREGEEGDLIVDQTPFYAESGGQVGDKGELIWDGGKARVLDVKKQDGYFLHHLRIEMGTLKLKDSIELDVDQDRRQRIQRNHSATHLLHKALKQRFGAQISQAGSLVAPDRLRFDFTHSKRLSLTEIDEIETAVNQQILADHPVRPVEMSLDEARDAGFVALFGEKYGKRVRTLSMGEFSKELCGGTHVSHTSQIGSFRILSESSVASGVRRIEAITGLDVVEAFQVDRKELENLAQLLKTGRPQVLERLESLIADAKKMRKQAESLRGVKGRDLLSEVEEAIREKEGIHYVALRLEGAGPKDLCDLMDRLRKKFEAFQGVLFGGDASSIPVVAAATKNRTPHFHAGNCVRELAKLLGGGGGGRPELAQGQGKEAGNLAKALKKAWTLIEPEAGS